MIKFISVPESRAKARFRQQGEFKMLKNTQPFLGGWTMAKTTVLAMLAAVAASASVFGQSATAARIMPLGDSLTSSINGQASYRYYLWKKLQAARYNVDFVGTAWGVNDGSSSIYPDFDQDHEGHPGATTDDILNAVGYFANQNQPDIVLLLIGGNDFIQGMSVAHAVENTGRIIQALRVVNPRVVVLLGLLPPDADPNLRRMSQSYNSAIQREVRAWTVSGSPVRLVNLWSGFSPSRDTVDGEHADASGDQKFASRFYSSLAPYLSKYRIPITRTARR